MMTSGHLPSQLNSTDHVPLDTLYTPRIFVVPVNNTETGRKAHFHARTYQGGFSDFCCTPMYFIALEDRRVDHSGAIATIRVAAGTAARTTIPEKMVVPEKGIFYCPDQFRLARP